MTHPHSWLESWFAHVRGDERWDGSPLEQLLRTVDEPCRGNVKFYRAEKGWGGIESADTPLDVWVHFSAIDGTGYRSLIAGELVEFRWEPAIQDSWLCRATSVRRVDDDRG